MSQPDPKLVWKILGYLGKAIYILRPSRFDFTGQPVDIRISGDVAILKYEGVLNRGLLLWFPEEASIQLPLLQGLTLETEVGFRNLSLQALWTDLQQRGIVVGLTPALNASERKWRNGDKFAAELKIPCATSALLDFPAGTDGQREVVGNITKTVFTIVKKKQCRGIRIENYEWRRRLQGLLPVEKISIRKNNEAVELQADISHISTDYGLASALQINKSGKVDAIGQRISSSEEKEIIVKLSFENPDDKYSITFETKTI